MFLILSCSFPVCCWKKMAVCLNNHVLLIFKNLSSPQSSFWHCTSVCTVYHLLSSCLKSSVYCPWPLVLLDVTPEWPPPCILLHSSQTCTLLSADTRKTTSPTPIVQPPLCHSSLCLHMVIHNLAFCPACSKQTALSFGLILVFLWMEISEPHKLDPSKTTRLSGQLLYSVWWLSAFSVIKRLLEV